MAKIIENKTFYYIERTIGNYVDYLDEEGYSYSYPNEYHSFATREKAQGYRPNERGRHNLT